MANNKVSDTKNDSPIYDFSYFAKIIFPLLFAAATASVGSVLWVQSYGEAHLYDIQRGTLLEEQVKEVKIDLRSIRSQNFTIIETLGRIEGSIKSE